MCEIRNFPWASVAAPSVVPLMRISTSAIGSPDASLTTVPLRDPVGWARRGMLVMWRRIEPRRHRKGREDRTPGGILTAGSKLAACRLAKPDASVLEVPALQHAEEAEV